MSLKLFQEDGNTFCLLNTKCPVCLDQGRHTEELFWKHGDNNCGGEIYVGNNAFYKCIKCGTSAHVRHWVHCCPSCSDSSDAFVKIGIQTCSPQTLALTLSIARRMVEECGLLWLQSFLANMGEW